MRANVWPHGRPDECHLCGRRQTDLADISYQPNPAAVLERVQPAPYARVAEYAYLRVCADCGTDIARVAVGLAPLVPNAP